MFIDSRFGLFLLVPLLCTPQISARQYHSSTFPGDGEIRLHVVVTPKSGPPVSGLQQQDFTVLEGLAPTDCLKRQEGLRDFVVSQIREAIAYISRALAAARMGGEMRLRRKTRGCLNAAKPSPLEPKARDE